MVVSLALVIYLICLSSASGPAALGHQVYLSSRLLMSILNIASQSVHCNFILHLLWSESECHIQIMVLEAPLSCPHKVIHTMYVLVAILILFQKHLWCKKKVRPRKCKLLSDLKMWYHFEAKKKSYTS